MEKKRKIAVIGGGIFGVTIALKMAKDYQVDLYEQYSDLLQAASGINQYRLHRGYHYPRSSETALSSLKGEAGFRKEYQEALIDDIAHFYCIAKKESKTSAKQFLEFLSKHNLEYEIKHPKLVNAEAIQLSILGKEALIDPAKLRAVVWKKLKKSGIKILLNTKADHRIFKNYDQVIICTYSQINSLLKKHPSKHMDYQYELCEKIVVKLPSDFKKHSIVILDGPFMCVDPIGNSGLYVLGNVVHAIHQTNIGKYAEISEKFKNLLNRGIIKAPSFTNYKKFIESGEKFIPKLKFAKHVGSMYTLRTVQPNKDDTDERLTTISKISDKVYTVFSGKIINCVDTAERILERIRKS